MNRHPLPFLLTMVMLLGLTASGASLHARERIRLGLDWRFHLGDQPAATAPEFADAGWRSVELPHDWSIEGTPAADQASAGGGGFFPTGIGWYRRTIEVPDHWQGQRVLLEFEGAAGVTEVWINGQSLGRHPYAYTPFTYDLTPHLRNDAPNTLAVRCDHSAQPSSRWYVGSGLYRPVWLIVVDPVHQVDDSVFIRTTDLFPVSASIEVQAVLRNQSAESQAVIFDLVVADADGLPVASTRIERQVNAGQDVPLATKLAIPHPRPWTPDTPNLYRAITRTFVAASTVPVRSNAAGAAPLLGRHTISDGGLRLTDRLDTTFGLRTVSVSARQGFLLNEEPVVLIGGNVHHDHGPLGAAVFERAEQRKVERLKAAGFNAVRTSHNPPSRAFLEACDRAGLLVVNEAFDGWARPKLPHDYSVHFAEWWERDLEAFIRRDRNHPSVVMWSIGNEVYERGGPTGPPLAAAMRERIRALDTTRPITAGINRLGKDGDWTRLDPLFASLDVAGYNYELDRHAADHARLPRRVILAAETYLQDAFSVWRTVRDHPYVIGEFIWSAQDYLGEAGIGRVFPPDEPSRPHWEGVHFPWHGAACGDLDLIGGRKPISHYRAIIWDRGERLHAAVLAPTPDGRPWNVSAWATPPLHSHWTWPGQEGRDLQVEVYSRHASVRLYLNDRLIGEKPTTEQEAFKAVFAVPYAAGTLRAVGVQNGREVETFSLTTAAAPAQLRLRADRSELTAQGQDVAFVEVEVVDAQGRVYPSADHAVTYTVAGPGRIAGIGSADLTSRESYQANPRRVHEGRALVALRSGHDAGELTLTATAPGLAPATLRLSLRPGRAP